MLRTSILACLLLLLAPTVNARSVEESSSEDAPFASTNKGPAPFAASPSAGFGAIGQWVITMKTTEDEGYVFFHKPSGGDWQLSLHPSLDYFITGNVSVGGTFGYFHSSTDTGVTVLRVGGRAGFNVNINDHLGFWPTAGVGFTVDSRDHVNNTTTFLTVFAPLLYHLVPHLFIGLGPSFSMQLDGDSKVFGIDFVLGGWL